MRPAHGITPPFGTFLHFYAADLARSDSALVHTLLPEFTSLTPELVAGNVSDSGLPAGTYYVGTQNKLGLIDRVHSNVDCAGCDVRTGDAITVTAGATVTGINLVLGDGELAEGSNWEAAMAAAHYKLDNLAAILDHNTLQITGSSGRTTRPARGGRTSSATTRPTSSSATPRSTSPAT